MRELYLGVDAGNAKTVALVGDAGGSVRGRGRAGTGDIYGATTPEDAVTAVRLAVEEAAAAAGAGLSDVRAAAFRLAGADWPEDHAYLDAALAASLPGLRSWSVRNDGFALLRCGDVSGVGVAVTVGTGPAVAARGPTGAEYSASWWIQERLGGHSLGTSALAAVVAAELGLGPVTRLTGRLLDLYQVPDVEALLHAFTRRVDRWPARAAMRAARAVLAACAEGDPVAVAVVAEQARALAGHARVAAERVGLDRPGSSCCVVLGGSVLASEHPALRNALTEELLVQLPGAAVRPAVGSPVAGALLDALAEGGVDVDDPLRRRVVTARHPEDFLLT